MKAFRTFLAVLAAGALIFGFAGCAGGEAEENSVAESASEAASVAVLSSGEKSGGAVSGDELTSEEITSEEVSEVSEKKLDVYYEGSGDKAGTIIVIDAGHQAHGMSEKEPNGPGSDIMKAKVTSGTAGKFTGISEYILNLEVSALLRDELISRGYTVVMVREAHDVEISNVERAQLANKYEADAFIRVHANGSDSPTVKGALTICQTRRNPYNSELYADCRSLSEYVLQSFCAATGMEQRSIWETDTMTGINWCEVPATIVEMGFMSNEEDDRLMATDEFRRNAAKGIADGIEAYLAYKTTE